MILLLTWHLLDPVPQEALVVVQPQEAVDVQLVHVVLGVPLDYLVDGGLGHAAGGRYADRLHAGSHVVVEHLRRK